MRVDKLLGISVIGVVGFALYAIYSIINQPDIQLSFFSFDIKPVEKLFEGTLGGILYNAFRKRKA